MLVSPAQPGPGPGPADPAPEPAWERRRRLDAVFGDVLPTTTADEREPAGTTATQDPTESWLKEQVPPHHG